VDILKYIFKIKLLVSGSKSNVEVFCEREFPFTIILFVKSFITTVSDVTAVMNYSLHATLEAFMVW
jgi:hypothetical protein